MDSTATATGTLALELNDAALVAARAAADGRTRVLVRSPGYAVVDASGVVVGNDAVKASRLKPRFRYTRFWEELDRSPLPKPLPATLSRADLVHAHLRDVWSRAKRDVQRVVLLVPGWYSDEQLGLLLGIARACEMPVTDMVDAALAGALSLDEPRSLHVDIHLHRTAAARMRRDEFVERDAVRTSTAFGTVALLDAWVTLVARTFVHQTRFDPLHRAETEQRLYDELPLVLDELRSQEAATLAVDASGKEHKVELLREDVVAAAAPYYREIVALAASLIRDDEPLPVALSHRASKLPGLVEILERDLSARVVELGLEAPAANALARISDVSSASPADGSLTFVTRLPLAGPPTLTPPAEPPRSGPRASSPTHVLHRGVAHPISPGPFLIGVALPGEARGLELNGDSPGVSPHHASLVERDGGVVVEDYSPYGCFVNGEQVDGTVRLSAGDRLVLGTSGVEVQLIEVKS